MDSTKVRGIAAHRRPSGSRRGSGVPDDPTSHHPQTRPRARCSAVGAPTGHLESEIIGLAQRMASGTYELLVLVGELDRRGSWAVSGALSCAAWLADRCEIEVSTARTQVRVARALVQFPELDNAMAIGDISYAQARVLVGFLTDDNVHDLLAIAECTPASRLGAAVAAWSQRNDDPAHISDRQHESRSVSWRTDPDGTVVITARLAPERAGVVCAAIDASVTRKHGSDGVSLAQQRADALVEAVGGGAGEAVTEVVVHVRGDGNTLVDGTPIADHAVTEMLPEAFVSLLIHDNENRPIDASPRRRFPTRRQRRVVDEMDAECCHPGCHATAFLQYDHIQPFAEGGPTVVANLRRLCGPHNRGRAG